MYAHRHRTIRKATVICPLSQECEVSFMAELRIKGEHWTKERTWYKMG